MDWQEKPAAPGHYWCRFKGAAAATVGRYEGGAYPDGSPRHKPVQVVGSDEIFAVEDFEPRWLRVPDPGGAES